MQQILDIFGYVHPVRLGYTWQFVVAAVLGLLAGIALSYELSERLKAWPKGTLAAILAFIVEFFVYRKVLSSTEEPTNYDGSALYYTELGLTLFIFLCVGIVVEIVARTNLQKILGR
jgi:hypothetical protein